MLRPSNDVVAPIRLRSPQRAARGSRALLFLLWMAAMACGISLPHAARAEEQPTREPAIEQRLQALIPELESLHCQRDEGIRPARASPWVSSRTTGSSTPRVSACAARPAARPSIRVPFSRLAQPPRRFSPRRWPSWSIGASCEWDDRVVDLDPEFQLKDPWVTREFRVFDLAAQRSGLPPYVNDMLVILASTRWR